MELIHQGERDALGGNLGGFSCWASGLGSSRGFLRPAGRTNPENGLVANFKRVYMYISLYAFREHFTLAGLCRY